MNIKDEVYTLEQLRKMNCLDGDKKLVFLDKVNEYIDERERIHQVNLECARKGAKKEILQKVSEAIRYAKEQSTNVDDMEFTFLDFLGIK